jgi:E3 ubiquitin-protein ligase MYCBP2
LYALPQVERVLERIIRSVDPLSPDFHAHVEPLYQRLSLCLEGSSKRIKLYSGVAAATSMGGGSMPASLASAGSRSSSSASASSSASSPSYPAASLPATVFSSSPAMSFGGGGGKGEAAQHPSAALYPPSGFLAADAPPPSYLDEDANERAFMELMRAEGSCSICDQQVGAENLRVESCTRDTDHRYCTPCLQKEFAERLAGTKAATLACPVRGCGNENLSRGTLRLAMSDEQIGRIETMQLQRFMSESDSFVNCPNAKCGYAFERMTNQKAASVSSTTGANAEQGLDGKPLSAEAIAHRDRSRYRCPQCAENFCAECRAAPYHLGYTCASFETYQSAKHCRFCETALTRTNTSRGGGAGVSGLVCTDDECQEKKKLACGKVLACTHPCCGIKGEDPCLQCLEEECQTGGVCKEDFCNICYTEGLGSAPTIRIACGHLFHFTCIQLKLRKRWTGSRITFGFLNCPLCKQQIDHPALRSELEPMLKMLEDIRGKAQQRLKIEGNDKDAAVCEPSGRYFRRPIDYAMDKFAYYPCFKCKQPYFGGQRQCEAGQPDAAAAAAGANGREAAEDFDASHLVCGGCADAGQECKAHGVRNTALVVQLIFSPPTQHLTFAFILHFPHSIQTKSRLQKEFIEWKCKFCCNISNWYCWGNTVRNKALV